MLLFMPSARTGTRAIRIFSLKAPTSVREITLQDITPEIVSAAEDFSDEVVFIPVSALGHSPEKYPDRSGLLIKPRDVHPRWVTIPLLYSYARWATGLIAGIGGTVDD